MTTRPTLVHQFWYDYLIQDIPQPTEEDMQDTTSTASNMKQGTEIPYLFPQWLLLKANYTTSLSVANAYYAHLCDDGPTSDFTTDTLPHEFQRYIETVVAKTLDGEYNGDPV